MSLIKINLSLQRGQSAIVKTSTIPEIAGSIAVTGSHSDDFGRDVYCVLGMPIDAIDMVTVLRRIEAAAVSRAPFLISTANLNFLVNSRSDLEFRESLLDSDLCSADGMPIVWIAWLTGVPIKERISGSDIFEALKAHRRRLTIFLFGGARGVAAVAARMLNGVPAGLSCVRSFDPGFGTVEELSRDDILDRINSSGADFLVVSLGAKKGQHWLRRNHDRLTLPIRAHLGAAINFQAGTVKRAPPGVRAWGLEWLWRIKEEPYLWRRYWHDGFALLSLFLTRVLPLVVANRWYRLRTTGQPHDLLMDSAQIDDSIMISIRGHATERHIAKAISYFRQTLIGKNKAVIVDFSSTRFIDERFFGLLLMLRKQLKRQGASLRFIGVSRPIARMFRRNELGFLLAADQSV